MALYYHNTSAPVEQAPGHGVGAVELRDGAGALVPADRRQPDAGQRHAAQRADGAAAVTRMVLRCQAQARNQTPGAAGRDVFTAAVALGGQLVAGDPTGASH